MMLVVALGVASIFAVYTFISPFAWRLKPEQNMSQGIKSKLVVITGASSGIGAASARYLAARGAVVSLAARRKDKLDALVGEIVKAGGKAQAYA